MAAVEQRLEYKHELYAGDLITVRSAILEVRNKTIRMTHEMTNDSTGELAAKATVIGVHMDAALRKAQPLPQDVRERAVLMFAEGAQGCRCLQPADHI